IHDATVANQNIEPRRLSRLSREHRQCQRGKQLLHAQHCRWFAFCTSAITMAEPSKNLMIERAPVSVWDRQSSGLQSYDQERWITAAWGSALVAIGARRGGFAGGLLATLGATVVIRAAMGRHDYRIARHWIATKMAERGWRSHDVVDHAAEES